MSHRPVAETEVQRILAMVPWLDLHPGATVDEIAQRFDVSADQVRSDLDLILMIGVPPYTPAEYIDVDVVDDHVWLRLGAVFRRPLRLSPAEGIAVLAAGRTLLSVPGSDPDGPLATGLAKLEAALAAPGPSVEVDEPEHLAELRDALDRSEQLEIRYWSAGRDETTARIVDPHLVYCALGHWYLSAYCHRAGDERVFRVDRIRNLEPTGKVVARSADVRPVVDDSGEVYRPSPEDPRVTLRLGPSARWIAEKYPTELAEEAADGRLLVTLAVSEPAWLERLLLQLGPEAEIDSPAQWRERRRSAARRVLDRYRS